jgi:hypothetical protein
MLMGGCSYPQVDTAQMPQQTGLADPGNAIQYAAWAFASPSRTRGDPISSARAVAALDYAAGAINTSAAWQYYSPLINDEMLQARYTMREVLGIPPTARSQEVENTMIGVSQAMASGDTQAALHLLSTPIFTLGSTQTLALLTNMPFIRPVNIATIQAEGMLNGTFCALGCGGYAR